VATTWFKGLKCEEAIEGIRIHRIIGNPFLGAYDRPQRKSKLASSLALYYFMKRSRKPLLKLLKEERFDVINAHFALPAGLPAVKAGKAAGTPVVTTLVGGDLFTPGEPAMMQLFRKLALPAYNKVFSGSALTAISTDTANRARAVGCKKEIAITPYGIDASKFSKRPPKKELLKKYGLEGKTVLISVCRLSRRKGLEYLLRALPGVGKGAKLLIVGDGVERKNLAALAAELGISDRVVFAGPVPNEKLIDYYNLADIFVLPSLHEGMGIVFLEAMACGLPVVTTRIGGMTDFVKDGETGLLVDPQNSEQLVVALSKLMGDKRLRQRIAADGEKLVRSEYAWEKAAKRYLGAFQKAAFYAQKV
jgi:glycosyltransferase involved in cell wall biosynthesis